MGISFYNFIFVSEEVFHVRLGLGSEYTSGCCQSAKWSYQDWNTKFCIISIQVFTHRSTKFADLCSASMNFDMWILNLDQWQTVLTMLALEGTCIPAQNVLLWDCPLLVWSFVQIRSILCFVHLKSVLGYTQNAPYISPSSLLDNLGKYIKIT